MEKAKLDGKGVRPNAKRVKGESMMSTQEYQIRRIRNSAALLYEQGAQKKKKTVDREERSAASIGLDRDSEERKRVREYHNKKNKNKNPQTKLVSC